MKRLAKPLSILAAAVLLLLGSGSWIVNTWLNSTTGRAFIERRVSKSIRKPVRIESLNFSMRNGVTARGVTIPSFSGNAFEASTVSIGHKLTALITGHLAFDEVRIENPKFRIFDEPPSAPPAPVAAVAPSPAAAPQPSQPVAPPPPASPPRPRQTFSVNRVIVTDGTVEQIDKNRAPVLTASGLDVTLTDVTERDFSGTFQADRLTLHGYASAEQIRGSFEQRDKDLKVRDISGVCGSGMVTASASRTADSPLAISVRLERVNVMRTALAAGVASPKFTGMLNGNIELGGLGRGANALTGSGTLILTEASCREIELLRQVGEMLQVRSLANFEISNATLAFRIADSRIAIAPLSVSAPPLAFAIAGTSTFDGVLDLTATLRAPREFLDQRGALANQFSPPDQENRRALQFHITGTLQKPKHDLAAALTGTNDRREQRVIAAGAAVTTILENTNIGKRNPKLMKLLPQLLPKPQKQPEQPPQPAPTLEQPQPASAQP